MAWRRDVCHVFTHSCRRWSLTITLAPADVPAPIWTLAAVYGPVLAELKQEFLDELRVVHTKATGPLLLCGDFNQIYQAANKNNDRLNLRSMWRFRRLLDEL